MLRLSTAAVALLAVAGNASAQAPPAAGQQPSTQPKPAQTTEVRGSAQNQPGTRPAPRNDIPANAERGDRAQASNRSDGSNIDSNLADCLILSNQEEIALLKFGMERTENDKIKQLAQKMVGDHEKAIEKLRKFASKTQSDLVDSGASAGARNVATREARKVTGEDSGSADAKEEKMNRLAHKMAQECLSLTKEELSQYKGHDFDQAFVGQQCGAHIGMLAKLTAMHSEASPEFASVAAELKETTKMHKDHLKKVMDSIKDKEAK